MSENKNITSANNIFLFAGFDENMFERVSHFSSGKVFLLIDDVIYGVSKEGVPTVKMDRLTKEFNSGFHIGMGCMGNGTVYWNKRDFEHGDYKSLGQITDSGKLIVRTQEPELVQFLEKQKIGAQQDEKR